MCESEETSRGEQHQEILGIIFAGILRMLLTAIEDARRNNMFINLPKFAAFMKYLSAGSGELYTESCDLRLLLQSAGRGNPRHFLSFNFDNIMANQLWLGKSPSTPWAL